jgi:glucuronokinase
MTERATGVAHARAGLLGNPSDVYGGKAIALSIGDFCARVLIEPSHHFEIRPGASEFLTFETVREASGTFESVGCEDGIRLIRAAIRRFTAHWEEFARLPDGDPRLRFAIQYETDIPRQVGLAGSSAIVIATLRALMTWFDVAIEPAVLAELALAAEVDDLQIIAGPMDRVIQAYGGVMLMDFREPRGPASYRRLDPAILPPLLIVWDPRGGKCSALAHGDLRDRWQREDPGLRQIMQDFRNLVDDGVERLDRGDTAGFRELVNRNFEMRSRIFPIAERDKQMIAIARQHGAAAKQCGSGGAVLGVPEEVSQVAEIENAYRQAGFSMIRPQVVAEAQTASSPGQAT